jgi:hypothetical protein
VKGFLVGKNKAAIVGDSVRGTSLLPAAGLPFTNNLHATPEQAVDLRRDAAEVQPSTRLQEITLPENHRGRLMMIHGCAPFGNAPRRETMAAARGFSARKVLRVG